MKKILKSYFAFSKTERVGIWVLLTIIIILLLIRITMPFWGQPKMDTAQEKYLEEKWANFKNAKGRYIIKDSLQSDDYEDANSSYLTPLPQFININTADSETLIRLKGIGPKTACKIISWRKRNKNFTDINQLKEIYSFPTATFEMLKRHLVLKDTL